MTHVVTQAEAGRDRFDAWLDDVQRAFNIRSDVKRRPPTPFYGDLQTHRLGRLTLFEVNGSSYFASHARRTQADWVSVLICLRGTPRVTQDPFEITLNPGDFCVLDSNRPLALQMPAAFRYAVVRLPLADVKSILPEWEQHIGALIDGRRGAGAVFLDTIRSILRQAGALEPDCLAGVAEGSVDLFAAALMALGREQRPSPSHLERFHKGRIRAYVLEHLREPDLDVETIGRELGLSTRHIHRLFEHEPQHLMHWVWSERLRRCYTDLSRESQRHRTVAQIAYSWGFSDPTHFSKVFRHRYGVPPSEVREPPERSRPAESAVTGDQR